MEACVNGIGLLAPGLEGWGRSRAVFAGDADWQHQPLSKFTVDMLPANERRRTTALIRLALKAAQMGLEDAGVSPANLASVFASSDGDLEIAHKLCAALCESEKALSPTQFHNSVHNAPAGYWAIAAKSHAPSTSVSAAEATFAAGLIEAMVQVVTSQSDVLLVAYDYPPPPPLDEKRDIGLPFALALVLGPNPTSTTYARLRIEPATAISASQSASGCMSPTLDALRDTNPAARAVPLLECASRNRRATVVLPYVSNNTVSVQIDP